MRREERGARSEGFWGRVQNPSPIAGMTIALVLSACGTVPKDEPVTQAQPTPKPPRGGAYYMDDGPPDKVPEHLAQVPDATPREEPFHRFANRPYTVFGKTYVPVVNKEYTKERGLASWYGKKFHGNKTASGEVYDMFAMTAAHRTLPIPSYVRVTNVKNGKSVVVRINDRGPFHSSRIIDLSYAAAQRIGIVATGYGEVEVERILPGAAPTVTASTPAPPTVETEVVLQEPQGLWLQIGAFTSPEAAELFRQKAARDMPWLSQPISIVSRDGMHRVRVGPYRNNEEASAIGDKVRRSVGVAPILVPH
jgi:rare lipoprotein A